VNDFFLSPGDETLKWNEMNEICEWREGQLAFKNKVKGEMARKKIGGRPTIRGALAFLSLCFLTRCCFFHASNVGRMLNWKKDGQHGGLSLFFFFDSCHFPVIFFTPPMDGMLACMHNCMVET
jgi:hypothetical protein